jgi:hypothetical protein
MKALPAPAPHDLGIKPGGIRDRAMRAARSGHDIEPEEWCRRRNAWERYQREARSAAAMMERKAA